MTAETEQLTELKSESWRMFDVISKRYDLTNSVLSFGFDKKWRKELIKYIPAQTGLWVLDVATGTADVPITLLENNAPIQRVYGIDMSEQMLQIGRTKIEQRGLYSRAMLQKGNAQDLNFLDDSFHLVTIAFGIRNFTSVTKTLMEMRRVLKPQGRILVLEFSLPEHPVLQAGHHVYLGAILPCLGFILSGHYQAYRYLSKTIKNFPYGERFCRILAQVGFKNIQAHPLMGGIATIYQGDK